MKTLQIIFVWACLLAGVPELVAAEVVEFTQPEPAGSAKVQWYQNYPDAVVAAKKANKPLLLLFTGTDWCVWCKKLDQEVLSTPEFAQNAAGSFIFVELDFPADTSKKQEFAQQNQELKRKFGITGFPTVVILDPNENFIAQAGYRSGGGKLYADYLKDLVR